MSTRKARYKLKASEESETKGIMKNSNGNKRERNSYMLSSNLVTLSPDRPESKHVPMPRPTRESDDIEESIEAESISSPVPDIQEQVQLPRNPRRADSAARETVEASPITPRSGHNRNRVHADDRAHSQVFPSQREVDKEVIDAISQGTSYFSNLAAPFDFA